MLKELMFLFYYVLNYPMFAIKGVQLGQGLRIRGKVYIKKCGNSTIKIGHNVRINSSLTSDPIGGQVKTILYTHDRGSIIIGNNSGLSNVAIVSDTSVTIGDNVFIGAGTNIYDTDFHPLDFTSRISLNDSEIQSKPVRIADGVFIGAHCLILKGVSIGAQSIVGAGSVVTKDIPKGELWAGNPAKYIRTINVVN